MGNCPNQPEEKEEEVRELPGEAEGICIGRKVGAGGDEGAPAARNP